MMFGNVTLIDDGCMHPENTKYDVWCRGVEENYDIYIVWRITYDNDISYHLIVIGWSRD